MAKVDLLSAIKALSGSLGKDQEFTFRRTKNGTTILIKKPDMSNVEWSPAQIASRQRLKDGVAFAQEVLADPERREAYERKKGEAQRHRCLPPGDL